MTEQKFRPGDCVRIRPFDLIDQEDIGRLTWTTNACYSIDREEIEAAHAKYSELFIVDAHVFKDSWVYHLRTQTREIGYAWAQGMLEYANAEPIEIPEADAFLAEILA